MKQNNSYQFSPLLIPINKLISLPVNPINTSGIVPARIAVALIDVDFAIRSRCSRLTNALITIDQILADTTKLAGITFALVNLRVTQMACITRMAHANERVLAVNTFAMLTG